MRQLDDVALQIKILKWWWLIFLFCYGVHYALGVTAIVLSTLVASKPKFFGGDQFFDVAAWLLAMTTGVFAFVTPAEIGGRYRAAWSHLSTALTRYAVNPSYTVEDVLEAYNQGEAIIHQTNVQPPKSPQQLSAPVA
jgi:hypothetical protein